MNLHVMGNKIRVVIDPKMEDNVGEFYGDQLLIKLKPLEDEDRTRSTILHEIIHTALYLSGVAEFLNSKTEEAIALALEHGLKSVKIDGESLINPIEHLDIEELTSCSEQPKD